MKKQQIYDEISRLEDYAKEISTYLWENPKTGGNEKASADYMAAKLKEQGFTIRYDEKLPTAFYAEWGNGKPVIAFLGEYDALPALSQKVCAHREAVKEAQPGHGCGHNLLGTASLTAVLAIKNLMSREGISGTLRYYGCPEEELLSGKVKMIAHGMFEGCDVALSWHPMSCNMVHDASYLASIAMKFHFKGKSSHAAFAPDRGRSALDAVELMNVGSNYLREHVLDAARIHYTSESYGYPPNIVPDKAMAWYCVRAPHITDASDIMERVKRIANGAAMMTDTEVEFELLSGCCEVNPNHAMGDLSYKNLMEAIPPEYTKEELEFARALQSELLPASVQKEEKLYGSKYSPMTRKVSDRNLYLVNQMNASSDSGDVSMIMPMALITTACWPLGVAPHTWQAVAAAGSSLGEKGMFYAAKVLAGICYDLLEDKQVLEDIQKEFLATKPAYTPLCCE